jgi:hypothetical protein
MKGLNVLELNQETMCAAVQVWLDQTFAAGHGCSVTKVESESSRSYGSVEFKVTINKQETA